MTLLKLTGLGPAKRLADRLRSDESQPTGGVGETLRAARRAMGVSLADAASQTHLRETYLTALEDDNVDALGLDRAYVRGALRSYADYLGLDATSLLARDRANGAHAPVVAEAHQDDPPPWHHTTHVAGGVVGLIIIAVVAFTAGEMLARRAAPPPAGAREGQHASIGEHGSAAPAALKLEFVEETWVRVITDDQTTVPAPQAGDVVAADAGTPGGDADALQPAAHVGAAGSSGPTRQHRRRSVSVVCDAALRCRIEQ